MDLSTPLLPSRRIHWLLDSVT